MKVVKIQFTSWDKSYYFSYDDFDLKIGDWIVVNTEVGTELGKAIDFDDIDEKKFYKMKGNEKKKLTLKAVDRIADYEDMENMINDDEKIEFLDYARELKNKYKLEMKFVDVHKSFDGSRVTFAFIADGRVDFRDLVKDLTRHFHKTIRLQQIGIRDEAKIFGDCGPCGKELCCRGHLKQLSSITSDMAEVQQCAHRGSDRISGICGRLMCCLAYEEEGYQELTKKMPPAGTLVNVDGKRGEVISQNPLKQAVNVKFTDENGKYAIVEVDLNRNKKNKK
ncbi:stage 0 sporulation protein [Candidatus Parcubacteria bacterium]|nr:stage 0 sporulation protein [Candidatus Parcubacteria bacterium]